MNYKILLTALIISGYFGCEDLERKNPVDPNVDISAPINLQLSQQNIHTVLLSWNFSGDKYDGFIIDRKIGSDSWQIAYDTVANDIRSYSDTSAIPTELHTYRIYSYADNNKSEYVTGNITLTFPAPTNLTATIIDDQSLQLSWTDNCSFESGYRIERNDGSGFVPIGEINADMTTYTDNGLTYGQSYIYRVKAYTDQNESDYSNELQTETVFPVPSNLIAAIIDDQSVQLTWKDNCTFEMGYKVERKEEDGAFTEIADLSANAEDYTDEGLTFGVIYTYRIQAYTNSNISEYSEEVITNMNVVIDIDGNVYQSVKIGDQYWMAENLKVTHYRNGDAIPNVTGNIEWSNLTTGAYCNYNNDDTNADTYGSLYNWYAVDDSRNIAPEGWHVPTDEEWKELEMYLGMSQSEADGTGFRGTDEGSKLKSTSGWFNNGNGTDDYGFSALPGSYRGADGGGGYYFLGKYAYFRSSTEGSSNYVWYRILDYNYSYIGRGLGNKDGGLSVRCVRD